mmetsp:Transcript_34287/g.85433  ORF Transcript_34287/g.85433 Transcript_34287/m.85433 type:complete len:238 (-) Transcript_34287:157-870(-)
MQPSQRDHRRDMSAGVNVAVAARSHCARHHGAYGPQMAGARRVPEGCPREHHGAECGLEQLSEALGVGMPPASSLARCGTRRDVRAHEHTTKSCLVALSVFRVQPRGRQQVGRKVRVLRRAPERGGHQPEKGEYHFLRFVLARAFTAIERLASSVGATRALRHTHKPPLSPAHLVSRPLHAPSTVARKPDPPQSRCVLPAIAVRAIAHGRRPCTGRRLFVRLGRRRGRPGARAPAAG